MTNEEYINTLHQLVLLARLVSFMDLDGFLARLDRAETLGPIIDPTLYGEAMVCLEKIKRLAIAAREFQTEARAQLGVQTGGIYKDMPAV